MSLRASYWSHFFMLNLKFLPQIHLGPPFQAAEARAAFWLVICYVWLLCISMFNKTASSGMFLFLKIIGNLEKCFHLRNQLWAVGQSQHYNKRLCISLASVAQWIESQPVKQRVACSIPSQGTCLGCGPGPQWGACERQPHIDVSLPLFLLLFPSL